MARIVRLLVSEARLAAFGRALEVLPWAISSRPRCLHRVLRSQAQFVYLDAWGESQLLEAPLSRSGDYRLLLAALPTCYRINYTVSSKNNRCLG